MNKAYLYTPLGTLRIEEHDGAITRIVMTRTQKKFRTARSLSPVLTQAMTELAEYITGKRTRFTVRTAFDRGTPFQQSVWEALRAVPYGKTATYGDIATAIGKPAAVRAVGTAIGANPLMIIVPCHRIIQKSGKIGGFAAGVKCKRGLHDIESIVLE